MVWLRELPWREPDAVLAAWGMRHGVRFSIAVAYWKNVAGGIFSATRHGMC